MENKSKELEVAIKAAREAGKILEKYFETELLHETKDDDSIVTIADKESEEIIKKIISGDFPEHSILGEETGHTDNMSEYTWHVDPLDATRMFSRGLPVFAVSLAIEHSGELLLGVVYNPITNTLFYAEKGKGAYLNDKKIAVSSKEASKAMIIIAAGGDTNDKKLRLALYFNALNIVRSTRDLSCTALELSYVASGALEADIQLGLKTYDFAAGAIIVLEAGGTITNLDGSSWKFPESHFIASNGVFHDKLVEEVKKQKEKL